MIAMIHSEKGRRRRLRAGAAVLLLLLTGCGSTGGDSAAPDTETPDSSTTALVRPGPSAQPNSTEQSLPAVAPVMEESRPVSFTIDALDREADIIETGLREDRTLQVPPEHEGAPASWFNGSPTPGEAGPAVLLGHVNSTEDDSGVFYNLEALNNGETITVTRENGSTAVFEVYKSELYPKNEFPTMAVYSPTQGAELRLITCDGFTEDTGEFVDNLVIYAKLTTTG
ncbi:sortase domain-containing protein [Arthrobacter sp. H14]|uniref:sortase domain-containing protein n=1 Tax=Arthrobacter sp. H14 TaxID=1312959 RepID=UPI0004B09A17|nr:sortase [Arthrobacter sp. H14]